MSVMELMCVQTSVDMMATNVKLSARIYKYAATFVRHKGTKARVSPVATRAEGKQI